MEQYIEKKIDAAYDKGYIDGAFRCWFKLSDITPDKNIVGAKVLLFRILNENQEPQSISVYPTDMVRVCNPDETWWMELPKIPRI